MKLSVVIPYFRAADTIGAQLGALARQQSPDSWEVVISDNEDSDDLRSIIRHYRNRLPNLRVVDSSDRRGEGHARNVGVEAARGETIAFCDADDEVGQGWLAVMNDALATHDFVGCRIDFTKLNPLWAQSAFRDHAQQFGLQRTRYPPYLPFAGGGTLGFTLSVFLSVGGFDTSWPVLTDKDFCLRVQLAGTKLHFVRDAVIHYRCRSTLGGLFKQALSFAAYDARIYRRYRRPNDMVLHPWKGYIGGWDSLLRDVDQLRSEETRAGWVWRLGWHLGLLEGSFRHRVPPI